MLRNENTIFRLLIGLAALFLLYGCSAGEEAKQQSLRPVIVMKAYQQQIANRIEAIGRARASESISITPKAVDTIDSIHFEDGQQVSKGRKLVQLDADEEQAQLAAAKAQLDEHLREITRLKKLIRKKAAASSDLEARQTQVEIARSTISEIRARIADRTLSAPFTGVVGIRRASVGELVQPGVVITTLDAVDPIKLDFSLPATVLSRLKTGMPVEATGDALPDDTFAGKIASIDSRIDPVSGSILVRALIDNPDARIKPGMLMHVSLLENRREALVVPEESVTQREDSHFLSLVGADDTVEVRKVSIGNREPGRVEILTGLSQGERVIVRGMGFVKAGQKVAIQETWEIMRSRQYGK